MKLISLDIKSHRQLQDLKLDFRYPDGHIHAGKPLNKICLIGQSATGKTSILNIIKDTIQTLDFAELINNVSLFRYQSLSFDGEIVLVHNNDIYTLHNNTIQFNNLTLKPLPGSGGGTISKLIDNLKLLYLSAEIISQDAINIFNQNPINFLNEINENKYDEIQNNYSNTNYVYEFGYKLNAEIWYLLLYKIIDYRKKFTQMASELINRGAIGDINKLNNEYKKWSINNPNPLESFAIYFNPLLKKLNLEVDLINTEYPIPIKSTSSGDVIPISSLSTGTKNLLLSMFPLFEIDTSNSVILIDEPERSLFPDIQIDLVTYFQQLAPEAQLIFATHSPFIAAAFEPEERFILYFDESGNVKVRRGESPIGDDPNDILRNDFGVDYYNDFGKNAYNNYLELKRKLSKEPEPEKKKEILIQLTKLGDKYNF